MAKSKKARTFQRPKDKKLWMVYQNIAQFATGLNKLPDAAVVKKDKPQPLPATMLDMVF